MCTPTDIMRDACLVTLSSTLFTRTARGWKYQHSHHFAKRHSTRSDMAGKRCTQQGCPRIITDGNTRCRTHRAEAEQARGTTAQRGYGANHQHLRTQWQTLITQGTITCPRCGEPITPTDQWDLGHNDTDRTKYNGPEHSTCNRSAGGRQAHT